MRLRRLLVTVMFASASVWAVDLQPAKSEPNLEKRSAKALELADLSITAARTAYADGQVAKAKEELEQVALAVELSRESLKATGKNPRRDPKHFKRAEMQIRAMLRRLKNLETDIDVADRPALFETERRLQSVHDELISAIMGKKK